MTAPTYSISPHFDRNKPRIFKDVDWIRPDGRGFLQCRPAFLKTGVVNAASGSSYAEFGNTKVIVSVFGPRESKKAMMYSDTGRLNCNVSYTTFSTSHRRQGLDDKEMSAMLHKSLEGAIILESFPKTTVDIFALVLESGGSDLSIVITCASLALADAGIMMYDLVTSVSVTSLEKKVVIDPISEEERWEDGNMMIAFTPSRNEITQVTITGEWSTTKLHEAMDLCVDGCAKLGVIMRDCLKEGDLVVNRAMIASRYLRSGFFLDFIAALPLPQVLMGVTWPSSFHRRTKFKNASRFTVLIQYIPRMYLALRLSSDIVKSAGVVTVRSWPGAFYNLLLYMLASHVVGTLWYLMAVDNQETCWRKVCGLESPTCHPVFLDCRSLAGEGRNDWVRSSNITRLCTPDSGFHTFGIFGDALKSDVTSASFLDKYFYCLWWGLRNLSSLGQGMTTSTNVGEIIFAIVVSTMGLVLFALLIGNMQRYLQSATLRLEEWRIKRTDIEEWMRHRQLPEHLQISVRKYDHCKWIATRGVDEDSLLTSLPMDLRRDIKRHLCYDLLLRVPLFEQLDERTLDAICERLKPGVRTEGTYLVREGDPVHEMLFIVRGSLDSTTTNGGRSGFFNICQIGPGDFCGEELLTWALQPRPSPAFPSSTRTVCSLSEVETFALSADDLAFVTTQFRRLHSKQLRHRLRFYSHQWRTWAACFIQAAWRRLIRRRTTLLSAIDKGVTEVAITAVMEPLPNSTTLMKPREVDFSGGQ